jgi:hypothetical protein
MRLCVLLLTLICARLFPRSAAAQSEHQIAGVIRYAAGVVQVEASGPTPIP